MQRVAAELARCGAHDACARDGEGAGGGTVRVRVQVTVIVRVRVRVTVRMIVRVCRPTGRRSVASGVRVWALGAG
jgi:hypothetical protein